MNESVVVIVVFDLFHAPSFWKDEVHIRLSVFKVDHMYLEHVALFKTADDDKIERIRAGDDGSAER